jgi:hypothetical protein
VFITVIVLGTTRPSSGSIPHARRRRPLRDPTRTLIDPECAIGWSSLGKRARASRGEGRAPDRDPVMGLDTRTITGF